ncbi:mitochondrial coenzyme A transporter SLC25A42 isoform X2 [Macrosteles quadrilineatus]|uniref:mitochondrial coenzyme A transporter SLC25A42 isoform X2 n=1 Tax=Macrosteles quadrilineatus TaxID=74068 RepID=UPI0023E1EF9E|nr:mitochondrial coenzyme A transporter SLC25A42 isoform X2 [Macrosteles quadrilineatus]
MEVNQNKGRDTVKEKPFWLSLVAGATAGAVAKTTIAPLDRTKINFQISNTPYTMRGALNFLINSYKTEGVLSLWRGNSATMARIIPYAAIQFTAHEQWKRFLGVDHNHQQDDPKKRYLAGSLAGVTSQSLTYPLDLARARMAITQKHQYSSLKQVFVRIHRDEGLKAMFRGYVPTILGVIPYAGTSFFTYGTLKRWYRENNHAPSSLFNLLAGGVSGMVAQTTSYPLDIVRRRMQTAAVVGTEKKYRTITKTFRHIFREEGIKGGFFKGLSMNWIKGPIAVGTSFATYDFAMETFGI